MLSTPSCIICASQILSFYVVKFTVQASVAFLKAYMVRLKYWNTCVEVLQLGSYTEATFNMLQSGILPPFKSLDLSL